MRKRELTRRIIVKTLHAEFCKLIQPEPLVTLCEGLFRLSAGGGGGSRDRVIIPEVLIGERNS